MIRINLLAPERATKKTKSSAGPAVAPGALQSYLLLALFAGGAALLCAGLWWFQTNTLKQLDTQIAASEKRQRDLQAIKLQVDQFEQKRAVLKNKVATIEQLRLAQKSPVHMLDEVSKAATRLRLAHEHGREPRRRPVPGAEQQPRGGRRTSSARCSAAGGSRR